jgi:hypothetical protein
MTLPHLFNRPPLLEPLPMTLHSLEHLAKERFNMNVTKTKLQYPNLPDIEEMPEE